MYSRTRTLKFEDGSTFGSNKMERERWRPLNPDEIHKLAKWLCKNARFVVDIAHNPKHRYRTNVPKGGRHIGLLWKSRVIPGMRLLFPHLEIGDSSRFINSNLVPLMNSMFPRRDIRYGDVQRRKGKLLDHVSLVLHFALEHVSDLFFFAGKDWERAGSALSCSCNA